MRIRRLNKYLIIFSFFLPPLGRKNAARPQMTLITMIALYFYGFYPRIGRFWPAVENVAPFCRNNGEIMKVFQLY